MELSLLILKDLLSKAIVGGVGFFGVKSKLCESTAGKFLASFTLYFTGPCALLSGFFQAYDARIMKNFGVALLAAFCVYVAAIAAGRVLSKTMKLSGVMEASMIFTNNGSFIISVIASLLGSEYVFYLSSFILVHQLLFFTYGVALITGEKKINVRGMLNPNVVAVFIGFVLFLFSIPLPEIVKNAVTALGSMHGSLCLILVGMALADCRAKEVFANKGSWLVSLIRLLALPMLAALVFAALVRVPSFQGYRDVFTVIVIAAACPTANNVLQIAMLYEKNDKSEKLLDATAENVLTTCLCVVTIPLVTLLYLSLC